MLVRSAWGAAMVVLALQGAADGAAPAAPREESAHVHGDTSAVRSVLSLDVYATGDTVDVLTGENTGGQAATLWHRRSIDGGKSWSQPVRVDAGLPTPHQPHRSNDPQIAADPRHIIAVWGSAGRGFRGSGALVSAISHDAGKTWRRGANPADDDRHDGHAFADLAARGGRFHLAWLDSRGGSQGVRYARSDDGGASWSSNASVKSGSCECCWNTLLPASERAMYLLFRGKGPRDMGLAASPDDGAHWTQRGVVGAYNWQIDACPHTGGALALTGRGKSERLHAVVWTGKPEVRGLHVLASPDRGARWAEDVRLGGEFAQRADLVARNAELIAAWDESVGQHAAVFVARSTDGGKAWSKPVRLSSENGNAVYPRLAPTRSGVVVLWTEAAADGVSKLRMVLMK
jgi:hypothetical protein